MPRRRASLAGMSLAHLGSLARDRLTLPATDKGN
jgi:hypothetical protein